MRIAFIVLVLIGLVALTLGPAGGQVANLPWYFLNTDPPSVTISGPPSAVRGQSRFSVELQPAGRGSVLAAWVDGQPVPAGEELVVDTSVLPDGQHELLVQVQDHSWARNTAQASASFVSDNTPPQAEVSFDPPSPRLGHTTLVRVRLSESGELSGEVNGRPATFLGQGLERFAILGFSAGSSATAIELKLETADAVGNTSVIRERALLGAAQFPSEDLQVPSHLEPLLGPEARTAEQARVQPVYETRSGPPRWRGRFLVPAEGATTTAFGTRRTYNDRVADVHHAGTDIAAPLGAPVLAANDATVAFVGKLDLRGNTLILDHGGGVFTTYAHLEEVLVQEGQVVRKAEKVAAVGSTGLSTGPHLHWEMWVGGENVDPNEWTEREFPTGG